MNKNMFNEILNTSGSSSSINFKKYLKLVLEKKHWVIISCIFFAIAWVFVYSLFLDIVPLYTTSAVIRFDDPEGSEDIGAVTDFARLGAESKVAILRTTSLLGKVVDSLKLNFVINTPNVSRQRLLKKVKIGPTARHGNYKVTLEGHQIEVYYFKDSEESQLKIAKQVAPFSDSLLSIELDGISLLLNKNILQRKKTIVFNYYPRRYSIEGLRARLETDLNYSKTILTLSESDKDPELAALITNTLANLFIEQLLEFKRFHTASVLNILEKQMVAAQEKLKKSEEELKRFRERNPYVHLTGETGHLVSTLVEYEKRLHDYQQQFENLNELLKKKNEQQEFGAQNLIYQEILSLLDEAKFLGASILYQEFEKLNAERGDLLSNYSPKHPYVVEVEDRLMAIRNKIDERADQYLEELRTNIKDVKNQIERYKSNLYNLPRKELRYAELQRNREINEKIVSNIMVLYNEAKVADAAMVPDAYVIDEALPPEVSPDIITVLIKYVTGFLLGVVFGIGAIILMDFINPSVREPSDVEQKLKLPVLATIPIIGNNKKIPDPDELKKKIDPKLITGDYSPTIEGEAFRMLRTKLYLERLKENRSLIITSLNPDEGKSLIASNLAITFAQQKFPTLLVDCDLRRGVLHNSFACRKKPGLSDILISKKELSLKSISKIIQKTHIPNLYLISYGTPIPNPSELLGSDTMRQVYAILKSKFGIIILDTAPIQFTPDAFMINSFVHNMLLVVKYGTTNLTRLFEKTKEFTIMKDDLVGVVINASQSVSKKSHYSYSYYQY